MANSLRLLIPLTVLALAAAGVVYMTTATPAARTFPNNENTPPSNEVLEPATTDNPNISILPGAARIAKGGTIQGRVLFLAPGGDAPDSRAVVPEGMKLELRPSKHFSGAKTATPRDVIINSDRSFSTQGMSYGSYDYIATAPGWNSSIAAVTLSPAEPFADITIRVYASPDIIGIVRDLSRSPIESVRVALTGHTERGEAVAEFTLTSSAGAFKFPKVAEGSYEVQAGPDSMPLRAPFLIDVKCGKTQEVVIEVPNLASIEATMRIKGTGIMVEGASVMLARLGESDRLQVAMTSIDGKVMFDKLLPGRYSLRATREYFEMAEAIVTLEPGQQEQLNLNTHPVMSSIGPDLGPPTPIPETPPKKD